MEPLNITSSAFKEGGWMPVHIRAVEKIVTPTLT